MFQLSQKTKDHISKSTGIQWNTIITSDIQTLEKWIQSKGKFKLNRFFTIFNRFIDMESLDKKLSKI